MKKELDLEVPYDVWDKFLDMAGKCGMKPDEMIETFLEDLTCAEEVNEEHKNGIVAWLNYYQEKNIKSYNSSVLDRLLYDEKMDDFLKCYMGIKENEEHIRKVKSELKTGVDEKSGITIWENIVDSHGKQCYSNMKEWENNEREWLEQCQEELEWNRNVMQEHIGNAIGEEEIKEVNDFCEKYFEIKEEKVKYVGDGILGEWCLSEKDLKRLVKLYKNLKEVEVRIEEEKESNTPIMFIKSSEQTKDCLKWEIMKFWKNHTFDKGEEKNYRRIWQEIESAVQYYEEQV